MKISIFALGLIASSPLVAARTKIAQDDSSSSSSSSSVEKKQGKGKIDVETVDIRFNADNLPPEQITDEHLDYLEFAIQYAFDETNPDHMYKSTGVKIQLLKPDDDGSNNNNNNQELQDGLERLIWTGRYSAIASNSFSCSFCPSDDILSDSDNTKLYDRKSLTKWAKAVCNALQESSLEGFKDVNGCKIDLPYGGVGDAAPAEEEEKETSLITQKKTRVVHSGKKKEDEDSMTGEDDVDVHFSMEIAPEDITDAHFDYLALAMQMSFDETNRAHLYKSTGVRVNFIEEEDTDDGFTKKEGVLRGAAPNNAGWVRRYWWYASGANQYRCDFCPDYLTKNTIGNAKTLKNWAGSLCDILNDSPLEGFKNAKGCIIELPHGGVEGSKKSDASTITSIA